MSNRLNIIFGFIRHYKYFITVIVCSVVVVFLYDNSLIKLVQYELQISELRRDIDKYQAEHEDNTKKLDELKRDPKAIEKIARERYFMKADDEDIYVLSDDVDNTQIKEDERTK